MTDSNPYDPGTPGEPVDRILKRDSRGRVQTPAIQREGILDEFERSGLSGAQFAKQQGINYQTFASWRQKRKRQRSERKAELSGSGGAQEEKTDDFTFLEIIPNDAAVNQDKLRSEEKAAEQTAASKDQGIVVEIGRGIQVRIENETQLPLAIELIKSVSSDRISNPF